MTTAEENAVREAIRRLQQADAYIARGDMTRADLDLLVARNGLLALLDAAVTPDTMAGKRRNAA